MRRLLPLEERSRVVGQIASQLNQIDRQIIQIRAELVGLEKETISYRTVRALLMAKFLMSRSPSDGGE